MERLQKVMARRGVASRRRCEELISSGRVTVNGRVVSEMGIKVSPEDVIAVDGRVLEAEREPLVYLLMNKPKGYVTTVRDPQGRTTVMDLLPEVKYRVYPVGRLDYDTEGLLLLTNDGELSYALTHPSHGVDKTYQAVVWGIPSQESLDKLKKGIRLEDGWTAPAKVKLLKKGQQSEIELVIHEGKKRQVRRMLKAVGHPVISLKRTSFGPLSLDKLAPGEYRYLTREEVESLKKIQTAVLAKKSSGGDRNGRQLGKRPGSGLYRKR